MKFAAASVAFIAAAANAAPATSKKALLKKAVRLAKEGRHLDQEEFQITGDYSIQFDHCVSFTVDNDEMKEADEYGNSLMTYIQDGSMVAQKSFVTFNVCPTEMCGYAANNDQYVIEAGQFVGITSTVDIKNHERYCEGCRDAQDYCLYGNQQYGEQANDQAQNQYQDGQARRLNNWQQDFEVVECDVCEELKCFEEENQYAQYSIQEQDIDEWIQQTAECVETGYLWQNMPLYAGFMCNGDGTGVELALFMDQDCSIYNSKVSFSEIVQSSGAQNNNGIALLDIAIASKDFVQGAFTKTLDCAETEYISPEQAYEAQQNAQNQQDNGNEWYKQAGETCQDLMQGIPMATCGYAYGEYREYREQNQDEYNAYAWYQPQLEAEDADDLQGVCSILEGFNGDYSQLHTYKKSESGSFYNYKTESAGKKAGKVIGWILLVACVAGAIAFVVTKKQKDTTGNASRAEPLV